MPDEDMDMDADQVARSINSHGKITVVVSRGEFSQQYQTPKRCDVYDPPDTRFSSKAVVKEKHVPHTVE